MTVALLASAGVTPGIGGCAHSDTAMEREMALKAQQMMLPAELSTEMRNVLVKQEELGPKPIENLTPAEARLQPTVADGVMKLLRDTGKTTAPEDVGSIVNRTLRTDVGEIPVRVYTPKGGSNFPVVVYFHGGGFVIATIDTYDSSARALCNAANAIIVSVEYRKAPEYTFPAQVDDAYAAYTWVRTNANQINGDSQRIAVAGESAGGNLATVVCMRAAEEGTMVPIQQVLIYPVVDGDMTRPSYLKWANAKPLNKAMMQWFFGHYLRSAADGNDPHAAPLKSTLLAKMPPTTIVLAEVDPLNSEGHAYAEALRGAQVHVNEREFKGTAHEFFGAGAAVPQAKDAVNYVASDLRNAFAKKAPVR